MNKTIIETINRYNFSKNYNKYKYTGIIHSVVDNTGKKSVILVELKQDGEIIPIDSPIFDVMKDILITEFNNPSKTHG